MITLGQLSDFTDSERAQLQAACDLVNKTLADPVFIARLMASKFDSTPDTNDVILANLQKPITITRLYCEYLGFWATHFDKTIAEEEPDGTVTFNRPFFDRQTTPSLANTLFHEACHVAGYHHVSAHDYTSVPYQCGDLLEDFCEQVLDVAD